MQKEVDTEKIFETLICVTLRVYKLKTNGPAHFYIQRNIRNAIMRNNNFTLTQLKNLKKRETPKQETDRYEKDRELKVTLPEK